MNFKFFFQNAQNIFIGFYSKAIRLFWKRQKTPDHRKNKKYILLELIWLSRYPNCAEFNPVNEFLVDFTISGRKHQQTPKSLRPNDCWQVIQKTTLNGSSKKKCFSWLPYWKWLTNKMYWLSIFNVHIC